MVGHDAQMASGLIVNKPIASVLCGRVLGGSGFPVPKAHGGTMFYDGPV